MKFPECAPQWWPECKDNIVLTLDNQDKTQHSVNLRSILNHWNELSDVTWVMREWQCNPCGTCAADKEVPKPRERTIPAEEAKALIISANNSCPWCDGPLDRLLDGGSYQCRPCGRTFHPCVEGLPNTEPKKGQVYCVNGSGPIGCGCVKVKIDSLKSRKTQGQEAKGAENG